MVSSPKADTYIVKLHMQLYRLLHPTFFLFLVTLICFVVWLYVIDAFFSGLRRCHLGNSDDFVAIFS